MIAAQVRTHHEPTAGPAEAKPPQPKPAHAIGGEVTGFAQTFQTLGDACTNLSASRFIETSVLDKAGPSAPRQGAAAAHVASSSVRALESMSAPPELGAVPDNGAPSVGGETQAVSAPTGPTSASSAYVSLRAPKPASRTGTPTDQRQHGPDPGDAPRGLAPRPGTPNARNQATPASLSVMNAAFARAQASSVTVALQATEKGLSVFARVGQMAPPERARLRESVVSLLAEHGLSGTRIVLDGDGDFAGFQQGGK